MRRKKLEKWFGDLARPGQENFSDIVGNLGGREMVIVTTSLLDIALAETLAERLHGPTEVIERFLGTGDEAGPGSTFSARITLALLTGLLTEAQAGVLHALRSIRNHMAHRVRVDPVGPLIQSDLDRLIAKFFELPHAPDSLREEFKTARKDPAGVDAIILGTAGVLYSWLAAARAFAPKLRHWVPDAKGQGLSISPEIEGRL